MTHRVLLKANRKLFSERTHLDKAIWILGRIVLFNGQHVAAKQSRLLRWLFKVIIWTSSHKLDHFLVFNVKMKKWFVFVSGKAQQQQLWERESHGGRGGGTNRVSHPYPLSPQRLFIQALMQRLKAITSDWQVWKCNAWIDTPHMEKRQQKPNLLSGE